MNYKLVGLLVAFVLSINGGVMAQDGPKLQWIYNSCKNAVEDRNHFENSVCYSYFHGFLAGVLFVDYTSGMIAGPFKNQADGTLVKKGDPPLLFLDVSVKINS